LTQTTAGALLVNQQVYGEKAAGGYERAYAEVSAYFVPYLLRAARLLPGQRVLDIATGTGRAAEAALAAVGSTGHVTAADISDSMVEQAKKRIGTSSENLLFAVEDGQALSFADASFDAVLCSLGLMFFPAPDIGLREFYRVLRPGGRVALSVSSVPERSFNLRISVIMGKHVPELAPAASRMFALGDEARLGMLIRRAGFQDVIITSESHVFTLPSFDEYFLPYEQGAGGVGETFVRLPEDIRRAVREDVRRHVGDTGGPLQIEQEIMFASAHRAEG
jgi:ubiquinone/menaquinone biosynthesis C-methylase UbiE